MLNFKFSPVNFISPLNNDTILKLVNTDNVISYILRNPDCIIKQDGLTLRINQFIESHGITLRFGTTAEAASAHLLLRAALETLRTNIINASVPVVVTGDGVNFNFGDWQDSVIDFVNTVPGSPIDGDRYIVNLTDAMFNAYNVHTDQNVTITLNPFSVVEYWDSTTRGTNNGGWVVIPTKTGMFTSIDNADSKIMKWNGSAWIELNWYLSSDFKDESPVATTQDGQYSGISPLVDKPAGEVSVNITVNGLNVVVGNGCNATTFLTPTWAALFAKNYAFSLATIGSNTITLVGPHELTTADSLIMTCGGVIRCYDIVGVSGNVITLSGTILAPVSFVVAPKKWSTIDIGDIMLWFGSYAMYQLQTSDVIAFEYITHN